MRAIITGATGQVGRALLDSIPPGIDAIGLTRAQCDLSDPMQARGRMLSCRPDIIINAAAYTQVDKAEVEPEAAYLINAAGAGVVAGAAAELGARMIHISTDFVFDGRQGTPYAPDSDCRPLNVYGASKLAGEQIVLSTLGDKAAIVRTAWIYSSQGSNFVRTMLRLMSTRDSVSVVSDQVGTPTWATSLAAALWALALQPAAEKVMHWTDAGVATWYDFAVAIGEEAQARRLLNRPITVVPIRGEDYRRQSPGSASRPAYSVLDSVATRRVLNLPSVHWRTHLGKMLDELKP